MGLCLHLYRFKRETNGWVPLSDLEERGWETKDGGAVPGGTRVRRPRQPLTKGWLDAVYGEEHVCTGARARMDGRCCSNLPRRWRAVGLVGVGVPSELASVQQFRLDQRYHTSTPEQTGGVEEHRREWNAKGDLWRAPMRNGG